PISSHSRNQRSLGEESCGEKSARAESFWPGRFHQLLYRQVSPLLRFDADSGQRKRSGVGSPLLRRFCAIQRRQSLPASLSGMSGQTRNEWTSASWLAATRSAIQPPALRATPDHEERAEDLFVRFRRSDEVLVEPQKLCFDERQIAAERR